MLQTSGHVKACFMSTNALLKMETDFLCDCKKEISPLQKSAVR